MKRIDISDELVQLGTDTGTVHASAMTVDGPRPVRQDRSHVTTTKPGGSELELVEPELWFRFCPPAADALAQAIQRRLQA